jgi:hypothetical protein
VFRSSQAGVVFVENRDQMENRRVNYCLRSGNAVGGRVSLLLHSFPAARGAAQERAVRQPPSSADS